MITIDAKTGSIKVDADLEHRNAESEAGVTAVAGMGRELFTLFRRQVGSAETGGSVFGSLMPFPSLKTGNSCRLSR